MIRVTVKLFGTLRRLSSKGTPGLWQGEIPDKSRISDLITLLGTKEAEVAAAMLNNESCDLNAEISDGAVVILVTPFGGG
jgi:molybdopterin converting factor small subunit